MENDPMASLPLADAPLRAEILHWLKVFAGYVREVDYAGARPMWHRDVLAFGTYNDVIQGLEAAIATQWDNVWPKTAEFTFNLAGTHVLGAADGSMAVAVVPWNSTGFHQDGTRFDRPGRATMVFAHDGAAWRCVHSHMSLNRGVPQASHGDRPVKAR
jgi:ketosteroid isomerase-like protein